MFDSLKGVGIFQGQPKSVMGFVVLRIQLEASSERALCRGQVLQPALHGPEQREYLLSFLDAKSLLEGLSRFL